MFHRDNIVRKQADKRAAVEAELKADATRSDRVIATACGGSNTFVGTVRGELVEAGMVSSVDTVKGRDGVEQPARKPKATGSLHDCNGWCG